ncbi:saccharopine dehydrogenase family protein [Roseiterribacter gracilis]|uniref:Saccharopine dehydrogenase n=1 Tax=Roseiterribacter gracilis TaxID=2812848 RepID=A0A8S8X9W7_9PROT|nr:saccharopine dehydrogenase [Rhodospirillales bacterium TMPK1]
MREILVVGSGNIGATIADLLSESGDYLITVGDRDEASLRRIHVGDRVRVLQFDASVNAELAIALSNKFAVLSAAPFHVTQRVAEAAHAAGVHYLDLTEDVACTRAVKALSATSRAALIPQCGLAPGFISIVARDLSDRFERLDTLRLRVGALPVFPSNALTYNLTWSTDGVINEYCEPCEAIVDGRLVNVPALEHVEHFALDGVSYEAFNTSGGLGTLAETLAGKVRELNYRTIRYPGHRNLMKALLHDLRLESRRDLLREVLEHAVPATEQDVVIIFVTATGERAGRLMQETYAHKVYAGPIAGRQYAAIQITTASAICAVLDLLAEGALPDRGLVRQEQIPLARFLANRFGRAYAMAPAVQHAA